MSTSILYHCFGIVGYNYLKSSYENGEMIFSIEHNSETLMCPDCGSTDVIRKGKYPRIIQTLPIGMKRVFIYLEVQRVECRECSCIKQMKIGFANERNSYSRQLERFIIELSYKMSVQDISKYLGMGWDTVKEIHKRYLEKKYSKPVLKDLEMIAIDEIAVGQGHKYFTVVMDMATGAIVFTGDGKGSEALEPFWKRLNRSRAQIKAVAVDMSPAYRKAIEKHLPQATIIYDHFHLVKAFNEKLSDFRRSMYSQMKDEEQKKVLKSTRWLLLKNPENLDDTKDESLRLEKALEINKPLAIVYYMKEDLRQIWDQENKIEAETKIMSWIEMAKCSGIRMLEKFAGTMKNHIKGILSWYDIKISTGPLEATNNKIKYILRQAFGFRDMEYFKLKIYAIHEAKYALIG